jgi:hypothetical protein
VTIELQKVRFLVAVQTGVELEARGQLSLWLTDGMLEIRNATPGHAMPRALVPLSNVAWMQPKPRAPEVKK